jgi:hypothetical protein
MLEAFSTGEEEVFVWFVKFAPRCTNRFATESLSLGRGLGYGCRKNRDLSRVARMMMQEP